MVTFCTLGCIESHFAPKQPTDHHHRPRPSLLTLTDITLTSFSAAEGVHVPLVIFQRAPQLPDLLVDLSDLEPGEGGVQSAVFGGRVDCLDGDQAGQVAIRGGVVQLGELGDEPFSLRGDTDIKARVDIIFTTTRVVFSQPTAGRLTP